MESLQGAIERIKVLECPTGDLENRVAWILHDYGVARRDEVIVKRDEELDRDGARAFVASNLGELGQSIVVLSKSGAEDYVAKVTDVYTV